jgi:hypothetical protein
MTQDRNTQIPKDARKGQGLKGARSAKAELVADFIEGGIGNGLVFGFFKGAFGFALLPDVFAKLVAMPERGA